LGRDVRSPSNLTTCRERAARRHHREELLHDRLDHHSPQPRWRCRPARRAWCRRRCPGPVTQAVTPDCAIPSDRRSWVKVIDSLNAQQRELLYQMVDELKRHCPAYATMIQLTYEHVADWRPTLRRRCCSGTPVQGEVRYI
jgi:hypothetical protein